MGKQYWIGEFFVDLSRNQISQLGQSQTLPPKALMVLTYLAENRGRVVGYDELLDAVWPNTVVTPNTLQRSIAQLRKALGENSKVQSVIKTHAKQGYSLESEVNWSDIQSTDSTSPDPSFAKTEEKTSSSPAEPVRDSEPAKQTATVNKGRSGSNRALLFLGIAVVICIAIVTMREKTAPMTFADLRFLTATDDKEFGASYTPDGNHILFRRYFNRGCINNIWAKDAQTLKEYQLTSQRGNYGENSLSNDGKTLVFIKEQDCNEPITQTTCYNLMSIDFEQALNRPQIPENLLDCQNSEIRKPIWIDDNHIALLQNSQGRWRVIEYSVEQKTSAVLFELDNPVINYAWSTQHQRFALTSIQSDGKQWIEMLDRKGHRVSRHLIQMPSDTPRYKRVFAEFIPNKKKLIFGLGSHLYSLSFTGEVEQAQFQLNDGLGAPYFNPNGQQLLLIKGTYDSDVATLSTISKPDQSDSEAPVVVFERSIDHEDIAKYHPYDQRIAFVSARTGSEQVWLFDNHVSTRLSDFNGRPFIADIHWNSDGESLLVLADMELQHVRLDGSTEKISLNFPVSDVFHWDSDAHSVIANVIIEGSETLAEVELATSNYTIINNRPVVWAAKSSDDVLIYTDALNRFWLHNAIEDKLIESLDGQLGFRQRFLLDGQTVYGINDSSQLWQYDISENRFQILSQVSPDIDYLSDVKNDQLLVTLVIAAKKEVIELTRTN